VVNKEENSACNPEQAQDGKQAIEEQAAFQWSACSGFRFRYASAVLHARAKFAGSDVTIKEPMTQDLKMSCCIPGTAAIVSCHVWLLVVS